LNDGLAICRFLSRKHIAPTNFEKKKVGYAREIFKPELTSSLRTMHDLNQRGFENVEDLCRFLEFFWTWYNYLDVCNLTQHYMQRLDAKKPFSDPDDPRLKELKEYIPEMLQQWLSKKKLLECLTKKTIDGLIFTSRSTANCIKHLLGNGILFVLTRRFSTDNIERFHGAIRHNCGSNDHP
jgi:hypothetical protein